jgi:hypothetical protein
MERRLMEAAGPRPTRGRPLLKLIQHTATNGLLR